MILISAEREMHKTTKLRLQKEFCHVKKTVLKKLLVRGCLVKTLEPSKLLLLLKRVSMSQTDASR